MTPRRWLNASKSKRSLGIVWCGSLTRRRPTMSDFSVVEQLNSVIARQPNDEVLVAVRMRRYGPLVERIVHECAEQGITVRLRTGISRLQIARPYVDELEGVAVMTFQ